VSPSVGGSYGTYASGTNVAGAIASISSAFANIFKTIQPVPSGCTQVAGPYGTSVQCLSSGQQSSMSLSNLSSSLGSSSGILLIGGAVLLVMMMKK
jgi:hypothetical protein